MKPKLIPRIKNLHWSIFIRDIRSCWVQPYGTDVQNILNEFLLNRTGWVFFKSSKEDRVKPEGICVPSLTWELLSLLTLVPLSLFGLRVLHPIPKVGISHEKPCYSPHLCALPNLLFIINMSITPAWLQLQKLTDWVPISFCMQVWN